MKNYIEEEVKILDINVEEVCHNIEAIGGVKIFDKDRSFTTFDYHDLALGKSGRQIRLTKEEQIKLSYSGPVSGDKRETIKLFVSREKEIIDFFNRIDLNAVTYVTSHRISYEWENVDLDIDIFPDIPPFLEIDVSDSTHILDEILHLLELDRHEVVDLSTPEIYSRYGIDYNVTYKIDST